MVDPAHWFLRLPKEYDALNLQENQEALRQFVKFLTAFDRELE